MSPTVPKIAFFSHSPGLYGANRSLLALIDGVKARGWECIYLSPFDGAMAGELRSRGVSVFVEAFELCCHRPGDDAYHGIRAARAYSPVWFIRAAKVLLRNRQRVDHIAGILRAHGISLVHSNSSFIPIGASVAKALGVPHVWHLREFGYADYGFYPDFGLASQRRRLASVGRSICISRAVQQHFFPSASTCGRTEVIYNGVESRSVMAQRLNAARGVPVRSEQAFTLASVGILHETKGHDLVIDAFGNLIRQNHAARLLIAGDGAERTALERRVRSSGLESKVEFVGRVPDMNGFYRSVDAVIVASRCEAMGRVAAEAMAHGLPVIGRNSGATPEIVEDGITGLLFDGSVDDLAAKMLTLTKEKGLCARLSDAGLQSAQKRFSHEDYVDAVCSVITDCLLV